MTMPRLPYSDLALNLSLIVIPLVFLFVWLFNAYRLGKLRRPVFIAGTVLILLALFLLIVFA